MPRTTITIDEDHAAILTDVRERNDLDSRAAAVRHCIEEHPRIENLESELHDRDARVDELRDELMAANTRIDASNELARAVERERTLEERRASAGVLTRARWWLGGMPDSDDE